MTELSTFAALALILAPAVAWGGESYDVRDANGRHVQTVVPNGDGSYDVRDLNGRRIETVVPDKLGGGYDVHDTRGRRIETVKPSGEPVEEGGDDE